MSNPAQSLAHLDLHRLSSAHWNLAVPALYESALRNHEVKLGEGGTIVVRTGQHTGRSPNDKFIVEEPSSAGHIWWGRVNKPFAAEDFDNLHKRIASYLEGRAVFVQDLAAGADPAFRLPIRIVTEKAWHALFAENMFLRPSAEERRASQPGFTILHVPDFLALPHRDKTHSSTFIIINFAKRLALIGGTAYAGEIKKTIFSVMNYLMPEKGVLPMHASANMGARGDTAVFFGLSGTGKTTLSADSSRTLIGDDEHGWAEQSVFNFEGGCYAKIIRLSQKAEPEIWATTKRFGTVLENIVMDEHSREIDLDDHRYAENTRACYPIDFIPNASPTGIGQAPETIIMLTADAFGVLPPLSKLSPEQAMYHFLSGYTARVAGTERGVTEPQATFSTCFGAPFLPRPPQVYAQMLGEKIRKHKVNCWLVNTGWSGGGYATGGKRMPIAHTRTLVRLALENKFNGIEFARDPNFGLMVPKAAADVPETLLMPRSAWSDSAAYDRAAKEVAQKFENNFTEFAASADPSVRAAAIRSAA